jgi:hypothetical protein
VRNEVGDVVVRLHQDPNSTDGLYLWVLNPSRSDLGGVRLHLADRWGIPTTATPVWGSGPIEVESSALSLTVGARNAVVARLALS